MNFYTMQLSQFLIKLRGLIKKISRTSNEQIEQHTITCHEMIADLIKDEQMLQKINGQKLRLLAYEVILFLVEMFNSKDQKSNKNIIVKNKIQLFLKDIYQTLASIKSLISNLSNQRYQDKRDGKRNILNESNGFSKLNRNLNQYQDKLGNILNEFEKSNQIKTIKSSIIQISKVDNDHSDILIQEMHRIIQKKQKRISELSRLLKQVQHQKVDIQISYKKIQNQMIQKNTSLQNKLDELSSQYAISIQVHQKQKQCIFVNNLKQKKKSLIIKSKILQMQIIGKKVNKQQINNNNEHNNNEHINYEHNNNRKQFITQQTICSIKHVKSNDKSLRKLSLENVSSIKSFRRIGVNQENTNFMNDKKIKQLIYTNQQLYHFIYCQATTIEQLM